MPDKEPDPKDRTRQREMALSRWDTDGGKGPNSPQRGLCSEAGLPQVPQLTDTELVHLRVRVIALENILISLLAQVSDQQLGFARELAAYIFPRPGFTQHPLTVHAAHQMLDLVERAGHFRSTPPT